MASLLRRLPRSLKYFVMIAAIGVAGIICATMPGEIARAPDDVDADWWKKILGKIFLLFPETIRSGAIRTLGIVLILGSCGGSFVVFQNRFEIDAEAAGLKVDLSEAGQRDFVMSILYANQERNNPYFLAKGTGPAPDEVLVIHPGTGESFTYHVKPLIAEDMWAGEAIDRIITAALSKLGQVPAGVQPVVTPPPQPNFDEWGSGRFGFDDSVASDFEEEEMTDEEWAEEEGAVEPGAVAGQAPGGMSPEEISRMVEAAAAAQLAQGAAGAPGAGASAASPSVTSPGASGGDPFAAGSRGASSDPFAAGSKSGSDPFASGSTSSPAASSSAAVPAAAASASGAAPASAGSDPFASSGTPSGSAASTSAGSTGGTASGASGSASGSSSGTAAADSLLAKARAKWDEQAYDASILLAEKALDLYRAQLPEGHATLAKVEAMIEAAEQKAKEQKKK